MALIICEDCQREVSHKAAACPHCGCPLPASVNPQVRRCTECGTDNAIDVIACTACGAFLTTIAPTGAGPAQALPPGFVRVTRAQRGKVCTVCKKETGRQRALGFATLFAVVITGGLWLLLIPFYQKVCMVCGSGATLVPTE